MGDFLRFRRMVTPVLIQVLFWLGLLATVGAGVVMMITEDVLVGLAILVLGPIAVRVYAELLIVLFRIHTALQRMARQLEQGGMGVASAPSAPAGGYGPAASGPPPGSQGPQGPGPQGGSWSSGPGTPPPPGGAPSGG